MSSSTPPYDDLAGVNSERDEVEGKVGDELLDSRLEESINLLMVASMSATSHESGGSPSNPPPRLSTKSVMALVVIVISD